MWKDEPQRGLTRSLRFSSGSEGPPLRSGASLPVPPPLTSRTAEIRKEDEKPAERRHARKGERACPSCGPSSSSLSPPLMVRPPSCLPGLILLYLPRSPTPHLHAHLSAALVLGTPGNWESGPRGSFNQFTASPPVESLPKPWLCSLASSALSLKQAQSRHLNPGSITPARDPCFHPLRNTDI